MARRRLPPDPRFAGIRVDNNFFDSSIGSIERQAADQIIELAESLTLSVAVPHTVRAELAHPNTPAETRQRAARLPYTLDTGMGDRARLTVVKSIMLGNAQPGKHEADASHLYDSALWQCSYFVTCDARLLRKDDSLAEVIDDLWIVRPSQLMAIFRRFVSDECPDNSNRPQDG